MASNAAVRRRLIGYLRQNQTLMLTGVAFGGLAAVVQAGIVWVLTEFVKVVAYSHDSHKLGIASLAIIGLYFVYGALRYGQSTTLAKGALRVGLTIRADVYAHLLRLSLAYYHKRQTGALLSALTNDINKLQTGAMLLKDFAPTPIQVLVYLISLFWFAGPYWPQVIVLLAVLPVVAGVIGRLSRRIRAISKETQELQANVASVMEQAVSSPRTIQAFGAENRELARFIQASEATMNIQLRAERRRARLGPIVDLIGAAAVSGLLYWGGMVIPFDRLLKLLLNLQLLATTLSQLGSLRNGWEEMMGAADRIFGEVLDIEPDIKDAPNAVGFGRVTGKIEFRRVSFAYEPGVSVLQDISLTIEAGEIVALVGETGAGKSTLADLVPRFYDPTAGDVLLDGRNLREVKLADLRRNIGIVPQETRLFHGTIRENLLYGRPDATEAELLAAARAANVDSFVNELAEKYETMVGDRGQTLSGGQRQRIAIARALLADPRILILDEATSALDNQTEALVQEALATLMKDRTTLIIAHRLSTIAHADRIVVLERPGRLAEVGTHAELLAKNGRYAALWDTQRRQEDSGA